MLQPGRRPRLAAEAIEHLGLLGQGRRQDFQSDDSVEVDIAGLVDRSHSPAGDVFEDLVFADAVAVDQAFADNFLEHRPLVVKGVSGAGWKRPPISPF